TRRTVLKGAGGLAFGSFASSGFTGNHAAARAESLARQATQATPPATPGRHDILYFMVDNLGMGELGCYGGGVLRGTATPRIDRFASESTRLLNFAPEAQCSPSRSALMTGRYSIRSGTHTASMAGDPGGLVAWERTLADVLSDAGYATACVGKWHIGASEGRWPTDHGFDEWYGPPRSYDESLWSEDPWYDPDVVPPTHVLESTRGQPPQQLQVLDVETRRNIDAEYLRRARTFVERSVAESTPFFLYFNHSMMHLPTIPRAEFAGASGNGDWADSLLQLDSDFGTILDWLDEFGIADNTIVVFSGDNGPEEVELWRGTPGYWEGSYFTGMEGSLRTPCLIRYPGVVPQERVSDEIVHITDMFPTLLGWAGASVPGDRVIDGLDQRAFFGGDQERSNREGFLFWNGPTLFGVKWRNFKMRLVMQKYLTDPALPLPTLQIINLMTDPKERSLIALPHLHTWVAAPAGALIAAFEASTQQEALIPAGAPLDFVPGPASE
ncbi:MAG: sulfatase-like hydrolase/transferase, partial [Thermomicrobiales bacterium]|nr:sulfatase-like hydrolase/transferase [Thermomicrobiales bacterium]